MVWLVAAGLHPRASETTVVVARDLASRMDYGLGLVLYDLEGTVRRTGLSRATVKRHVAVLRELAALVWVRHGSKRNLRLPGRAYTATATVYGAVIPRVYDEVMGNRITGDGYEARVCGVTERGRERAVAQAGAAVDERAVDNSGRRVREPHSRGSSSLRGKVQMAGGVNDTSRARRRAKTLRPRKINCGGVRRSARQVARDIAIARQVRPLVPWAQRESLRRLAFALRPLIDRGLDARAIADELYGMCLGWRPARPAAYIQASLARDLNQPVGQDRRPGGVSGEQGHGAVPNADWGMALVEMQRREGLLDVHDTVLEGGLQEVSELDEELKALLAGQAVQDLGFVRSMILTAGEQYARQLYGDALVHQAKASRSGMIEIHSAWDGSPAG
ncbi:cell wall protein [Streptomyces sp. NPDC087908]|uniref:cell wall protein n=1 Tax=Streptomyces sp. NPDC087908 TaxID=3365820 RepID=UPI00380880A2